MKGWIATVTAFLLRHVELPERTRTKLFLEVLDLFKNKSLSIEERQMLTVLLLDRLGALPLHAKIKVDKTGMVVVNGRSLNSELADQLRQAAVALKRNKAYGLIKETVTHMAIVDGVHKNINPEMGLFSKAALWFLQEMDELIDKLGPDELEDE